MIADNLPYVFLLVVVGCLTIATPVCGLLALFGGLMIALKVRR